jgi:citrate/tricarballylate utilization protein
VADDELTLEGRRMLTVCNACRYCEGFCPVFPALERRPAFAAGDLSYLANLCHNCGECLYACQYAPPHAFGVNVPRTLAEVRLRTYADCCWPRSLAVAFRRQGVATAVALAAAFIAAMFAATAVLNPGALTSGGAAADFYAVVPHGVMVALFGSVFGFVLVALAVGLRRFRNEGWADRTDDGRSARASYRALRDALTLRHLHGSGLDCTSNEEARRPWRRWFHHCTFYGFALCFASTTVAAVYHFFGWPAPYAYTSAPVVLGTVGGIGLLVGPAGLLVVRTRRDPALGVPDRGGLDDALAVLLFLTSLTGIVLLLARTQAAMPALLIVHLGCVFALFVTLPYGKFVHGVYRVAALLQYAREESAGPQRAEGTRVS